MKVTRRWFIGGMASMGALAGCKAVSVPAGTFAGGKTRLRLGIISDIHVDAALGDFGKFGDTVTLEHTLAWFGKQGVDGVIIAGDMADNGMLNQLQCVADAWYRVFPNEKGPDGRHVEKLFVYGNHDLEGHQYDKFDVRYFERDSFEKAKISRDPKAAWETIFHEEYKPIYMKQVKGYTFIGAHWRTWDGIPELEAYMKENGGKIDPGKPFFFAQHPHPQNTCYGPDAWGHDKGFATRALSPFPNAIAFSGHSHMSLTEEGCIWQGAFTSIGTSSLRYADNYPYKPNSKPGWVNTTPPRKWDVRQGLLMTVTDDSVTVSRRDFMNDASLGDDWVFPLPSAEPRPFAFAGRAAKAIPPQFAADAALTVKPGKEKVEKGKDKDGKPTETKLPTLEVTVPAATATAGTRASEYEIVIEKREGGVHATRFAADIGFNLPRAMAIQPTSCLFLVRDLPKGTAFRFVVSPMESFGKKGKSIASDWMTV